MTPNIVSGSLYTIIGSIGLGGEQSEEGKNMVCPLMEWRVCNAFQAISGENEHDIHYNKRDKLSIREGENESI